MKKLTAFLSAMTLGLTTAPMTVFAESADATSAEIQMGDVNGDGYIDASDATLTLRYYTMMLSETDPADILYYDNIVKYGDINGDGTIDALDASWILRKYTEYLSISTDGDINRDGVVDVTDACLILYYWTLLGAEREPADIPYYDNIVRYGDMNGDDNVDLSDASLICYLYETNTGEEIGFIDAKKYLEEKGII